MIIGGGCGGCLVVGVVLLIVAGAFLIHVESVTEGNSPVAARGNGSPWTEETIGDLVLEAFRSKVRVGMRRGEVISHVGIAPTVTTPNGTGKISMWHLGPTRRSNGNDMVGVSFDEAGVATKVLLGEDR